MESHDPTPQQANSTERDARMWAMLLHLSLFAGYLVPFAGLIAPIVIWQVQKDSMPEIDAHGKVVANWIISHIIYFAISILLVFVVIGIPLVIVLSVLMIVFPIVGCIKASNGEVWSYPMSIKFFS